MTDQIKERLGDVNESLTMLIERMEANEEPTSASMVLRIIRQARHDVSMASAVHDVTEKANRKALEVSGAFLVIFFVLIMFLLAQIKWGF